MHLNLITFFSGFFLSYVIIIALLQHKEKEDFTKIIVSFFFRFILEQFIYDRSSQQVLSGFIQTNEQIKEEEEELCRGTGELSPNFFFCNSFN